MAEFFRRGVTRVFVVPTIVNLAAPTVAEITAGDEITDSIADISGFRFSNSRIPIPKLSNPFTGTIAGENTADDSTLTFYEDDTANPLRATFAMGTQTNLVFFSTGTAGANPAAADEAEVWPVESGAVPREWSMGNDPARWMAEFGTTEPPEQDAVVAA